MTDIAPKHPHRLKIALTLLIVLAAAGVTVRWWRGPVVATDTVSRRDLVQTVVASGHVEAPHRVEIGAQITGTVRRVPASEGSSVDAGDLLVELESTELNAAVRLADVAVAQARARLRQLLEVQAPVAAQTVRQAQASLDNARAAQARSQALHDQGFIGQAALDDARKTTELADAQWRASQRQLDTTGPAGSDRALALANVESSIAGAQSARARAGYAFIKAPVAGTLIGRNVEAGDVVQAGKVLMTLSPTGRTQLVVAIDEKNLSILAVGQPALASADAYPQQTFAVQLAYINPGINVQTGAVEVKLDASSPPPTLRQDMTVSVDIEVSRRPQTLVLPAGTLRDAASAAPWVLRIEGGLAVRRAVRLGLRSGGLVEILDGLNEGDAVVSVPALTAAGARVRAAAGSASAPP